MGWTTERLSNKIGDRRNRINSLNASLNTMGVLKNSSQVYGLSQIPNGAIGGVTLNTTTNVIVIKYSGTANFVHEITHAGQFETGDLAFVNTTGETFCQDIYDEVAAYRAQFAYNPLSMSGLNPNVGVYSFNDINTSWVQGVQHEGMLLYAPNVGANNTGIIPVNINSTGNILNSAYPSLKLNLPNTYTLKLNPSTYYKK